MRLRYDWEIEIRENAKKRHRKAMIDSYRNSRLSEADRQKIRQEQLAIIKAYHALNRECMVCSVWKRLSRRCMRCPLCNPATLVLPLPQSMVINAILFERRGE